MKYPLDVDKLVTCLGVMVNMNGGEIVIPRNERELIDVRELSINFNSNTGTVTIRLTPQPEEDWGSCDV